MGIPGAVGLGSLVALGLGIALGWRWGVGVLWGAGTILVGYGVSWAYLPLLGRVPRPGVAAGVMGGAKLLLYAVVSFLGISLGLAPLAVCIGLLIPGLTLKMRLLFRTGEG
ncbi:hypothetical protein ACVNPS_03640 [Candidatus Bipolaricaulota sp. J31]